MQLNKNSDISSISQKTGFAIFEFPEEDFAQILTSAHHFHPNEKGIYTKDDIDSIAKITHDKQTENLTLVLEDAEKMNEAAANTFLKTLEEPSEYVHFVFLVRNTSKILPTIKSRAHIYYLSPETKTSTAPQIEPEIMKLAKQYIACTPKELGPFCDKIAKDKKNGRTNAIKIVDAAIQILYKSYFVTGKSNYLNKLDSLLRAAEALNASGNIRLQLASGML